MYTYTIICNPNTKHRVNIPICAIGSYNWSKQDMNKNKCYKIDDIPAKGNWSD